MSNDDQFKPLKRIFQEEQKKLLGGFTAFGVATLLLVIQGSISVETIWGVIGLVLIAAAIPASIVSYLISLKILETSEPPVRATKKAENFFSLTLAATAAGFTSLLFEYADILASVLAVSSFVCFFYFSRIMKIWEAEEQMKKANDVEGDD